MFALSVVVINVFCDSNACVFFLASCEHPKIT